MCKAIIFAVIFINYNFNCSNVAAATLKTNTTAVSSASLQQSYVGLREDVRWFFERLENLAATVELMLPNATATQATNRTLANDTRMILLSGVKHLVTGTKELCTTFRKNFDTDLVREFLQLTQVTSLAQELMRVLRTWFANLRALVTHLFSLYNYYIPEVLFGKCMGKYIVAAYPERLFYEYPVLLLMDIFNVLLDYLDNERATPAPEQAFADPIENEILHSEPDELNSFGFNVARSGATNNALAAADSIFNLSEAVAGNKEAFIDKAAEQHSLKQCLKLYTAETLIRQLKIYFLS